MIWQQLAPYLRLVHDYRTPVDFGIDHQQIQDHAMHYFVAGFGEYELLGQTYRIEPGMVFLVPPETEFSFEARKGTAFHMLNIHFDPIIQPDSSAVVVLYRTPNQPKRPAAPRLFGHSELLPASLRIVNAQKYETLFAQLAYRYLSDAGQENIGIQLSARAAFLELLGFLIQTQQTATSGITISENAELEKTMAFMQERFTEPLNLPDIARHIGWSRSQLSEQFKARFGCSPMKFVTGLRLEKAKQELAYGTSPIKEVARMVGYESVPHFARAFKKYTGATPANFRERHGYSPKTTVEK